MHLTFRKIQHGGMSEPSPQIYSTRDNLLNLSVTEMGEMTILKSEGDEKLQEVTRTGLVTTRKVPMTYKFQNVRIDFGILGNQLENTNGLYMKSFNLQEVNYGTYTYKNLKEFPGFSIREGSNRFM